MPPSLANMTDDATTTSLEGHSSSAAADLSSPNQVREWIAQNHVKQLSLLDKFEMELRLGRLSTLSATTGATSTDSSTPSTTSSGGTKKSSPSPYGTTDRRLITFRTVELLRTLIGQTKWKNAAQLMTLLRGLGMELHAAGGYREPVIGNVVRRIMCAVRIEVINLDALLEKEEKMLLLQKEEEERQRLEEEQMERIDEDFAKGVSISDDVTKQGRQSKSSSTGTSTSTTTTATGGERLSLSSMLWAHPQHYSTGGNYNNSPATNTKRLRSGSLSSVDSSNPTSTSRSLSSGSNTSTANTTHEGDSSNNENIFPPSFYVSRQDFRQAVMEAIQEIMLDLEDVHKNINDQASSHIHAGEIILTYGRSKTVELFLKAAAKKRQFQVIVCEGAPHFGGHTMAKSLADAGIDTTVIHDSAIFAIMARVNKVLLPSHAVLANGGLIAPSGSHMVALAASHNSIPLVSLTGLFKLCPMFPHEGQDTLQDFVSPAAVVDYSELCDDAMDQVELVNPVHDYVPPQLINLYVTNIGAFQPSYTYRLLAEYYHSDDLETFE